MPILGISSNRETLELFSDLEEVEETIKVSLAMERVSVRVAGLMGSLDSNDRLWISDLFTSFRWSFNHQCEAIHWIIWKKQV